MTQHPAGHTSHRTSLPPDTRADVCERGERRVAILLGAEAYQAHHVADIALELARKGARVDVLATLPDSLAEFSRLSRDQSVSSNLLFTPLYLRVLQRIKFLGSLKTAVLRHPRNVRQLSEYDAIVTPTDHARVLRSRLKPRPAMVYVNHGVGGRAASYSDKYSGFDFVVVASHRDEERLLADDRITSGHYVVAGYARFETAHGLHGTAKPSLFSNDRPVVLFNPHSKRALRSWDRFARSLIDHAARTGEFNLIVAPHVKLFGRRPRFLWKRWERRAVEDRVIVDLGSARSLDMTYALAADVYVGDVSSQLYEFLSEPKPCVFLNAHRLRWRNNRDFQNWRLGDVADTPAGAIEAIRSAFKRHHIYKEAQAGRIAEVRDVAPGAAGRAADAILSYVNGPVRSKPLQVAGTTPLLFLISDLGTGGTARATLHVVNGLAAAGADVSLVVMRRGGVLTPLLDKKVKLISARANMPRGIGLLLNLPEIIRLIRSRRPSTIISSGNHMHLVAAVAHAMAGVRGCALVLKMTNPVERANNSRLSNAVRRKWYGWAFGRADKVLVIAAATRTELAEQYPRIGSKLRVVDNPYITQEMIEAGRSANEFEPGRLLAIGRLVSQKNYSLLLHALARIRELDWTLDILGDGPLLGLLQGQARALGIDERLRFRGFVTDPVPYLQSAHALVLSSAWEGQGAVLLEALASGCPVIATHSTAAVGDVLANGFYGKLTPAGDAMALADAIAAELQQRTVLPPSTAAWVSRYEIDAGVGSHLQALDVNFAAHAAPDMHHDVTVRQAGPLVGVSADGR